MTASEILQNAYVVTGGGARLRQFRAAFAAVGLDAGAVREWRECRIPGEGSLGNAVAQYALVRHALAQKLPWLVVFEDDAVPCDAAGAEMERAFRERPRGCLCLSLGWSLDSDPEKGRDRAAKRRVYGSHAYALLGERAYRAYLDAWPECGCADRVLARLPGSFMAEKSAFAQHTVEKSVHLPSGWTADAELERLVDREARDRYAKARSACERLRAERSVKVAYTVDIAGTGALPFADQLLVSARSLRESAGEHDEIDVAVFFGNLHAETARRLQALSRENFRVSCRPIPNASLARWNAFAPANDPAAPGRTFCGITWARFALPWLWPEAERCIYIDCDTMARRPIRELWETDLGGRAIGACRGTVFEYGFYSGCLLLDLAQLRAEEGLRQRWEAFAAENARRYYLPDQTAMNEFYRGRIAEIPGGWIHAPSPGRRDPATDSAPMWHFYEGSKPRRPTDDHARALLEWQRALEEAEEETKA